MQRPRPSPTKSQQMSLKGVSERGTQMEPISFDRATQTYNHLKQQAMQRKSSKRTLSFKNKPVSSPDQTATLRATLFNAMADPKPAKKERKEDKKPEDVKRPLSLRSHNRRYEDFSIVGKEMETYRKGKLADLLKIDLHLPQSYDESSQSPNTQKREDKASGGSPFITHTKMTTQIQSNVPEILPQQRGGSTVVVQPQNSTFAKSFEISPDQVLLERVTMNRKFRSSKPVNKMSSDFNVLDTSLPLAFTSPSSRPQTADRTMLQRRKQLISRGVMQNKGILSQTEVASARRIASISGTGHPQTPKKWTQRIDSHWSQFLERVATFPPKMREAILIERVRNDSAVIAGLSSQLQQVYEIIADLGEALDRGTIDLSQEPQLHRNIDLKVRDVSSVGGRLEKLVQNVAKQKLLDARSKLRMSADNNALKMEKLEMQTHRHQCDLELKKLKRAFTLLEHQNQTLQSTLQASQKVPQLTLKQSSHPANKTISMSKLADILQHTKAVLDRIVRDQKPQYILRMVEQSLAILLGCQATVLVTLSSDLKKYEGEIGGSRLELPFSHRTISKILKGAERMFTYNDSLQDPTFTKSMSQMLHLSISNLLVFPVHNPFKKKIDAFLIFINKSEQQRHGKIPSPFGRSDEPLLQLCAQLSVTYLQVMKKSAKLKEEQYQKREGLIMLDSLYSTFSFGSFVRNVEQACAHFFRSQRATFLVCDQIRRQLYRRIPQEKDHDSLESFACDLGISGFVASSGTPFVGAAIENDSRFLAKVDDPNGKNHANPARDLLAVPIILESEADLKMGNFDDLPKGVLVLINKQNGAPFSQEDNDYVCSYAPLIGRTLDVVQKFEKFLSLGDLFSNLNSEMRELSSGLDQSVNYYHTLRRNYQSIADLFGTMNQPDRNPLIRPKNE